MDNLDLCYAPATQLVQAIRRREVSPVEVIDAVLDRIATINPTLNAYVTVTADLARQQARVAEMAVTSGDRLGPLHGIPYSLKDLTSTKGIRTTFGSKIFENHIPSEDAIVVERLRTAGAILLGKTNTPEFGCKVMTDNKVFGTTHNPWKLDRTPGGSSGGAAAAVAAGLGPLAEGSDMAGSIRIPASFCGIVGLMPSKGRIPRLPVTLNTIAVHGPLARTVADTALMLGVMSGPDHRDPLSLPDMGEDFSVAVEGDFSLQGLRLAWTSDLGIVPIDPIVRKVFEAALETFEELGAAVEYATPNVGLAKEIFEVLGGYIRLATADAYTDQWAAQMDSYLVDRLRQARGYTLADLARAELERLGLYQRVRTFFEAYDLLVLPTVAVPPFPISKGFPTEVAGLRTSPYEMLLLTYTFNLMGQPAISLPCGWTEEGLPVGLQIVGWRWNDALVLRAAAAFEAARPWAERKPREP